MVHRAVVYSRVSTDAQERDGTSLDTQERACLEYAKDSQVVERLRDTASGASLDRSGIEWIRQLIRQGSGEEASSQMAARMVGFSWFYIAGSTAF
jgi:DNA invertase Pin-like site-specific DNA recombinase